MRYGDADAVLSQIPFVGQLFAPPAGYINSQTALQDVAGLYAETNQSSGSNLQQYMPIILIGIGALVFISVMNKP
jgi:hypothetical protein